MYEKSLDRRAFLALSGAATVAGATVSIASAEEVQAAAAGSWRDAPELVADDQIGAEYAADFIVIGMGHAGTSCARTLAEGGADVIAIDSQAQDAFSAFGEDFGHIGSQWLADQGVTPADPVEFFNNWMLGAQNLPNPSLVMQYAQNSGECFDWWVESLGEDFMSNVTLDFWPRPDDAIYEIAGQKFYSGTPQFIVEGYCMTDVIKKFHELYQQAGGRLDYGVTAQQLVKDGDRVAGVIATDAEGNYVKYTANKAVVLTAGDFGGNIEMCKELCTQITDAVPADQMWMNMGRDGSGIRMGLWAGGHLEPRGLATMGGDTCHPGILNQAMTGLWFNDQGKRFCNEFFGDTIWTGRTVFQQNRDTIYCLYDGKLMDQLGFNIPAHNRFDPTDPEEVANLQALLDSAVAAGADGVDTWDGGMVWAADTIDAAADMAGMPEDVKAEFLAQVEHYNELCAAGVDTDFGKDARVLWAMDTAPYYLVKCPAPMVAFYLVTVGGLVTDGDFRVLDDDEHAIPGLYTAGNCCGRRFGSDYFSPTAGVSLGMANTHGRCLGKKLLAL